MGTPDFAVASLKALVDNRFNVVAVVTTPDKPAGRGQQVHESAVKKYAVQNGLKVLQPEKLKDEHFVKELRELNADLQLVVAFRMLPEVIWNMPPLGTYNLHASLLPKYRGAAPINWALINGETESGVTTFKLKHEIDTGNILFFEKVKISETMSAGELHDALMEKGAELILKTVSTIEQSNANGEELSFLEQDNSQACHAPKIFKETCRIDWNNPVKEIHNFVRGLSPYPAAHTGLLNTNNALQVVKIFVVGTTAETHNGANGLIVTDNKSYLKVLCSDGLIEVKELQLEGKRRMGIAEFLRGYVIKEGAVFI